MQDIGSNSFIYSGGAWRDTQQIRASCCRNGFSVVEFVLLHRLLKLQTKKMKIKKSRSETVVLVVLFWAKRANHGRGKARIQWRGRSPSQAKPNQTKDSGGGLDRPVDVDVTWPLWACGWAVSPIRAETPLSTQSSAVRYEYARAGMTNRFRRNVLWVSFFLPMKKLYCFLCFNWL